MATVILNTSEQPMDVEEAAQKAKMLALGAGSTGLLPEDLWAGLKQIGMEPQDGRRKGPILSRAGLRKVEKGGTVVYVHVSFLTEKTGSGKGRKASKSNRPAKPVTAAEPQPPAPKPMPEEETSVLTAQGTRLVELNFGGGMVTFEALDGHMSVTLSGVHHIVVYFED